MTKAKAPGAPRLRSARSCIACKSAKAKCLNPAPPATLVTSDDDPPTTLTAERACDRCQSRGTECLFDPNAAVALARATGTPSSSSGQSSLSPQTSILSHNNAHQLFVLYSEEIHPFLPLFSTDAKVTESYLATAPPRLRDAIRQLAAYSAQSQEGIQSPPPAIDHTSDQSKTLADLQADLIEVYLLYGQGKWEESNSLLARVASAILERGWHMVDAGQQNGTTLPDTADIPLIRRLFWQTWSAECGVSILLGSRDFYLLNSNTCVQVEDDLPEQVAPTPHLIRAMRLALSCANARDSRPLVPASPEEIRLDREAADLHRLSMQAYGMLSAVGGQESTLPPAISAARTTAQNAALYASAAIVLADVPSWQPGSYSCGIDYTQQLSQDTRTNITKTLDSFLDFLRRSVLCRKVTKSYGPHFGCTLVIPSAGALLAIAPDDDQQRRQKAIEQLEFIANVLEQLSHRWTLPGFHLQHVRLLQQAIASKTQAI